MRAIAACVLGWLVPGAGHLYLGRRNRGLIFVAAIGALFVLGVSMDAGLQLYLGFDDPLAVVRTLAKPMVGLPYLAARLLGFGPGEVTSVTYEYGNTFTEVAGLLNVLVILDAWDTAVGRRS